MTIATATGQGENAYHGVEVALLGGACLPVGFGDSSSSDLLGGGLSHWSRFVWYALS